MCFFETHIIAGRKHVVYYTVQINHVYLHRPNAFGFWQLRLHLCYETLKRISNFLAPLCQVAAELF